MNLSAMYIYPLKSGRGIAVPEMALGDRGPVGDRRWMLVGPDNVVLTQRELPRMVLIHVVVTPDGLECTAAGMTTLRVSTPANGFRHNAQVLEDTVDVMDASEAAGQWFSAFLARPCRLVYQPQDSLRPVDTNYAAPGTPVSLADAFPLLLIGQGSLDDLNRRLQQPVEMIRFRPNLVVEGSEPFAEDTRRRIRIGQIEFDVSKQCVRCTIPMVDPATGTSGKDPIQTLATFRRHENKVMFGQNLIHRRQGTLRVGEPVVVLD
jgi:uncharacterized protein YcbX